MSGARTQFIICTDIAGSSRLAELHGEDYLALLGRHDELIARAVASHHGSLYKHLGDGMLALFDSAESTAACAVEIQCELGSLPWLGGPEGEALAIRIALHGGVLTQSGSEYFGPALNRASRICQVISGGQVVASSAVISLLGGACAPPADFATGEGARATAPTITDLGEHHLRDLAEPEHLYQLDHPGFALHDFPPLATLDNRPNNLVEQPNRFIGRVRELAEMEELLADGQRLITITAPGGYGKSRLAAQLCANLLHRFERGCFMVYLAPVHEALDVPFAIGQALGYPFGAGRTPEQQLCDYLRNKALLLCLDNMEHLLECAQLVADILKAAPKVKVIITSREPLRIEGEQAYHLEPMCTASQANGASDAEKLFADRARLIQPNFVMDATNKAQVQALCVRLSGIPLAIELAAAWMDGFTLGELLDELSGQLELEARTSDKPARHQSLKACLDWSWNLLGEAQQEMLMRLSVFRGGFFADAASAVLSMKGMALRGALAKLCDKSWLYTREVDGQTRYFLRDMLAHEYAFAKLEATQGPGPRAEGQGGEEAEQSSGGGGPPPSDGRQAAAPTGETSLYDSAVSAHGAYFAALVEREGPRLTGGGTPDGGVAQRQATRCWQLELENISGALDSALHRRAADLLLPIAIDLYRYFATIGAAFPMRERYQALCAAAKSLGDPTLEMYASLGLSRAHLDLGQYAEATALLLAAQRYAGESGDREVDARALAILGNVHTYQGDYARSAKLHGRALAIFHEIGQRSGEVIALNNLGMVLCVQGDYRRARELYSQAVLLSREIGNRQGESNALSGLGLVHYMQGDYTRAVEMHTHSLEIRREIDDPQGEAASLTNLGLVHYMQGDYTRAVEMQHQSIAISREFGAQRNEAISLGHLGRVHHSQGDFAQAATRYSQALRIFWKIGVRDGVCNICTVAAAALAALKAPRQATIALHGGLAQAAALNYHASPENQKLIADARARLDATVASREVTAEQLSAWQADGEAMSLDELAEFVLSALAEVPQTVSAEARAAGEASADPPNTTSDAPADPN